MDGAAAVGTSLLFARQDHIHPFDTATVRVNVQSLTATQQQQARQNIVAAPFDAMAFGGLQINGAADVSQERGSSGTGINGTFICDGWALFCGGPSVVNAAALNAPVFAGLPNYISLSVSTAEASSAAGSYVDFAQMIEGLRCTRLGWGTANAQPITIGFWSCHHRTGIYSVSLRNAANNRSYSTTYTQAASDVPQYNTVTIPGDVTGTWAVDNTGGIQIIFAVAAGSLNIAPSANAWVVGGYAGAPGQVNGVGATSDVFRIAGVIVIPGNEAPSAARSPFIMRNYMQELPLCMRYYQILNIYDSRWFGDLNAYVHMTSLPVIMRAAPTMDTSGLTTTAQTGGYPNYGSSTATFNINRALPVAGYCNTSGAVKLSARL